jgi:tetratricopeptide (TPR) repeat protein
MTPLKLKPWLARFALTLGVPALLLGGLELGLRLAGFGRNTSFLIPDEQPGYFRTNPDFTSQFLPAHFELRPLNFRVAAHKPANTVRIVVLGESAAQGIPVPSLAFAPQLRAQLRARYPGQEFEVLDTGIVAINSHVFYQIARDLARFEPDLFVVYAGNNEVIGPYGPGCAYLSQMPPLWVIRASVFVRSTRTGQLLARALAHFGPKNKRQEWGGMAMFVNNAVRGDDVRLSSVDANFRQNLRDIVHVANRVGAKTLLCTPVANLKDCPPLLSVHRIGFSDAQLAAWKTAFDAGRLAWKLGDADRAKAALQAALKLDDQYADTSFMLGSLALQSGDVTAARTYFLAALHWDALRFRPDPSITDVVREVAHEEAGHGATLLDIAKELGSDVASTVPLSGRELLFEHVHFDWEGNYWVARLMADAMGAQLGEWPAARPPLDSAQCAAALAYTPHERWPMLLRIQELMKKPPFTNQLTYVEDQAKLAREIEMAKQANFDRRQLAEAKRVAETAVAADPNNPALAGILEGIRAQQGDTPAALELARKAKALLPSDAALAADEASLLSRAKRQPEAESLLMAAARSTTNAGDLGTLLVEVWADAHRAKEGKVFFDELIARSPQDVRLRIGRAAMLRAVGDRAGAEQELRTALVIDPTNADVLENLIALLEEDHRTQDVGEESLRRGEQQPENQENNFRAVKAAEAKHDEAAAIRFMKAAERSGPVNSTFELNLALKVYQHGETTAALEYLAEARKLSAVESNAVLTKSIDGLIAKLGAQVPSK